MACAGATRESRSPSTWRIAAAVAACINSGLLVIAAIVAEARRPHARVSQPLDEANEWNVVARVSVGRDFRSSRIVSCVGYIRFDSS